MTSRTRGSSTTPAKPLAVRRSCSLVLSMRTTSVVRPSLSFMARLSVSSSVCSRVMMLVIVAWVPRPGKESGRAAGALAVSRVSDYPPTMARNFVGYGETPPEARWPGGARVAVNVVINYEEGSENRVEDGQSHRETTGQAPLGWYCRYGPSPITRELVAGQGSFLYDSDSYADDLPYWAPTSTGPWLVVPYALDTNDIRFWRGSLHLADDFFAYLRDAFDQLWEEGETRPRMMSVGLHCRIAGRPGRTAGLARFLDHAQGRGQVWFAKRGDIARHWSQEHPSRRP